MFAKFSGPEIDGDPCLFKLAYEQLNASCSFCFLIHNVEELVGLCDEISFFESLQGFEVRKGEGLHLTYMQLHHGQRCGNYLDQIR